MATGGNALVEIIDLSDPESVCQNLPDFPNNLKFGGEAFSFLNP